MPEERIRVHAPTGGMTDGVRVPVEESTERCSDFVLADGTILRAKVSLASAIRVEGHYDQVGNPMYQVHAIPVIAIVSSPDQLRKKD
jgi:hypothetical protein